MMEDILEQSVFASLRQFYLSKILVEVIPNRNELNYT